jgi:hypothetical protein
MNNSYSYLFEDNATTIEDFRKGKVKVIDGEVYLRTCHPIMDNKYESELKDIVEYIKSKINYRNIIEQDTIGVHIRRSDHINWLKSIKQEPKTLEYFINKMNMNIDKCGHFFLCTDDEEVSRIITDRFNNVITNKNIVFKRSTKKESNISALIDLFSLCECKYIIGTPYSTFSDFPRHINKEVIYI